MCSECRSAGKVGKAAFAVFPGSGCGLAVKIMIRALRRYLDHEDPLAGAANLIAVLVGLNLPGYAICAGFVAGPGGFPAGLLTLSASPLFLALPRVSRSHPNLSRALLPIIGTLNTIFSTWVLGQLSGTQMFFMPVLMAASLLFRRREAWLMLPLAALPAVAFLAVDGRYPLPPHSFDLAADGALRSMNAVAVACLTVSMGLVFSGVMTRRADVGD